MEAIRIPAGGWMGQPWRQTMTRLVFLGGMVLFATLLWRLGPAEIFRELTAVGPWLPLVVLPYLAVALCDALGWWFAFPPPGCPLGYRALFRLRLAAKAIHETTPAFSLAGELIKVHLLRVRGVPWAPAMASVVLAKTTITLAELAFLFMALGLVSFYMPAARSLLHEIWLGLLATGVALIGVIVWERQGLSRPIVRLCRQADLLSRWVERSEEVLQAIDTLVAGYLRKPSMGFWWSCLGHFLGWLAGALETWVILAVLGLPTDLVTALAIEAFLLIVQGVTGFVPANLGTLEAGAVAIFAWVALPSESAFAFVLLRRLRQLIWIGAGFGVLGHLAHTRAAPVAG